MAVETAVKRRIEVYHANRLFRVVWECGRCSRKMEKGDAHYCPYCGILFGAEKLVHEKGG